MHFTSVVDCLHTLHAVPDLRAVCCHPHVSNSDLSFFLYLNM